jgi:hypothetical protein
LQEVRRRFWKFMVEDVGADVRRQLLALPSDGPVLLEELPFPVCDYYCQLAATSSTLVEYVNKTKK